MNWHWAVPQLELVLTHHSKYDVNVAKHIAQTNKVAFRTADNKFEALAAHDAIVEAHGALLKL